MQSDRIVPVRRAVLVTGIMVVYASYFQSKPLIAGVFLGGILAIGNFYLLHFFVSKVLESQERQGRLQRFFRGVFFIKFLLLSLLLYNLGRLGLVDLTGFIGGFTAVLLVVLHNYFLMLKEERELNGTSASIY